MNFKRIYEIVERKKGTDLSELLKECNADLIYDNDLSHGLEAWSMVIDDVLMIYLREGLNDIREQFLILHELGHHYCDSRSYLSNKRSEESSANLFSCLYLLKNNIWQDCYFSEYLMCNGCDIRIANCVNDRIFQYKLRYCSHLNLKGYKKDIS